MPSNNAQGVLAQFSSSPKLAIYAEGLAQSAAVPVAENIAPTVPVATAVGFFKVYTQKDRFFIPEAARSAGEAARKIGITAQDQQYVCQPYAYDYPIDRLFEIEEEEIENSVMEGARMISEMASLYHENMVVQTATNSVPAGAGNNVSSAFSSSSVDPVAIIDAAVAAVMLAAATGSTMGVTLTFGVGAWLKFKNNANVRGRFVVSEGAPGGSAGMIQPKESTINNLILGNPNIRVSYMVKDTAPPGQPASMAFVMNNQILVVAARATPDRRDPSFMKTFRVMGRYMVPRQYVTNDNRGEVVGFDWIESAFVTNAPASYLITTS